MDSESLSYRHSTEDNPLLVFLCNYYSLSLLFLSVDNLLRYFHGENDALEVPVQAPKRPHTLPTAGIEVMRGLSMHDFLSKLEPFLRSVVREEVERGMLLYMQSSPKPSLNQLEESGSRGWQLHFINRLPGTLFTGSRIEAENGEPLKIVIVDASSKSITTYGPLSSIKIEILVLDGDFGADEEEDWTEKEFDNSVIREREGKRPLVTGDLVITMKDGVGLLGEIAFTDNSSWIRSRKFRLGARAVQSTCGEERIREARSGAFIVKDHRGELYKKHHPPSFNDEVWRLERIGKDGAFHTRLASKGVKTVQDFLRLYVIDQSLLRSILGSGMSNKTWETIVQHATACILDDKFYTYYSANQKVELFFNSIYEVIGATFEGHYHSLANLNTSQMILVEGLKRQAYRNVNDIVEMKETPADGPMRPLPLLQVGAIQGSSLDVQHPDLPFSLQDQMVKQSGFNNLPNPATFIQEDHGQSKGVGDMQECHPTQLFTPIERNDLSTTDISTGPYRSDMSDWATGGSSGPVMPGGHLVGEGNPKFQFQNWFPLPATWDQGNGLFLGSGDETGISFLSSLPDLSVHVSRSCKPNMGWFKLRAAVKWGISVRRDLAAKRRARLLQLGY
ncbi:PREDICTED: calmodulin-binding protein 60 D-like isoform X2 [Nelumbo nucifera]|uniref:Calmodulin-binding protein 60 D-like isoform X2 n=1 Tax=Nelumbo nucifera TaxID=4432 RepID=A0A1U8APG5_NELNU|nr:PREDICTED: calmodulin-binding protein 60 D-like isoform X2 [Nelumbo nucifera]